MMEITDTDLAAVTVSVSMSVETEFKAFFEVASKPMLRLAFLLTSSNAQAEEAVQECFVKVFERWQRIDDKAAYMRTAVVNHCTSWHRHRAVVRNTRAAVATDESYTDQPDELADALAALPARRRAVVVLRFYEGLDIAGIATTLGTSEGTVKSTLHRALAQLKGALQ
ncbi:MAG: SigE family polymerase sigma factor [Aeromicrobium sp.]|nr:SigE family polymerase sigma factor [Aeromicrobium sp.]